MHTYINKDACIYICYATIVPGVLVDEVMQDFNLSRETELRLRDVILMYAAHDSRRQRMEGGRAFQKGP